MTIMALAAGVPPFPGMVPIRVWAFHCLRCDHEWLPRQRSDRPKVCPTCKSPYWDRRRRSEQ